MPNELKETQKSLPTIYYLKKSIIKSSIKFNNVDINYAFRNYYYIITLTKLAKKCVFKNICLNTKYLVSLVD